MFLVRVIMTRWVVGKIVIGKAASNGIGGFGSGGNGNTAENWFVVISRNALASGSRHALKREPWANARRLMNFEGHWR
jgi:hypothetical protein